MRMYADLFPRSISGWFLPVLLMSCTCKMDAGEYGKWVRDYSNGLHVKKTTGGYVFDVQYMPPDYLKLRRDQISLTSHEGFKDGEGALFYYELNITPEQDGNDLIGSSVSNAREKRELLYYFSYHFQNDLYLEVGEDRLPCVLYHFERASDLKPGRTFLLGFESPVSSGYDTLLVIDSPVFGSIPIKIRITNANTPTPLL